MVRFAAICFAVFGSGVFGMAPSLAQPKGDPKPVLVNVRGFDFTYAATFKDLPQGKTLNAWLPLPQTTLDQVISISSATIPGKSSIASEPQYGNQMLYFEAIPDAKGQVTVSLTFKIKRSEFRDDYRQPGAEKIDRFLQADKLVPLEGKPLTLLKDHKLGPTQRDTGKILYDIVNNHMKYSKAGTGWGNGDAEWACDSKFGNCSDFHSLFISLARANKIPAKFEMGFPIPPKRGEGTVGGYHCWAWLLPDGKGWMPVDISEANQHPQLKDYYFGNLTADRVMFTTGRDIDLVPRQKGPALNFFIYPYAELGGQPLPTEQIQRSFAYKDF
ncbi:MAG TPA: transglutaminase domain-containing protein [Gemmataceae bacterium]|nr:transglutaminase domain-containing protein [Gemmataceae bacterium]